GIGQQFAASLTGNIEQARLLIYDHRGGAQAAEDAAIAKIATEAAAGAVGGKLGGMAKAAAQKAQKGLGAAKAQAAGAANKISGFRTAVEQGGAAPAAGSSPPVRSFLVHFNPSQIQTYASNIPTKKPDAQGADAINDSVTKATLSMTVTLYFDEMNVYDSFMADKFTMGVTAQGAKNIAAAVMTGKGKVWSVQDEVEGLVGALRNPLTRNVSFRWAEFAFTGQLINVSAKYTMFSTVGRPVRAQVVLRIKHEMDDSCLCGWYANYDQVFGGGAGKLGGLGQKMGNVINLNL
ncbi:MAG: hypothetical protein RR426_09675, partial [Oscillospiraceae bacterium]